MTRIAKAFFLVASTVRLVDMWWLNGLRCEEKVLSCLSEEGCNTSHRLTLTIVDGHFEIDLMRIDMCWSVDNLHKRIGVEIVWLFIYIYYGVFRQHVIAMVHGSETYMCNAFQSVAMRLKDKIDGCGTYKGWFCDHVFEDRIDSWIENISLG